MQKVHKRAALEKHCSEHSLLTASSKNSFSKLGVTDFWNDKTKRRTLVENLDPLPFSAAFL